MLDPGLGHLHRRLEGEGRARHADRIGGHHLADRRVLRHARQRHPVHQVLEREDPDRPDLGIDDHHRADLRRAHAAQHLDHRGLRPRRQRRLERLLRQREVERAVLAEITDRFGLHLPLDPFEQPREAVGAIFVEARRKLAQRVEGRARHGEADDLADRALHVAHRPAVDQRADGEALAGHQLPGVAVDALVLSLVLADDQPFLEDVEPFGGTRRGIGHRLAVGEADRAEMGEQVVEMLAAHPVVGRMPQQELTHPLVLDRLVLHRLGHVALPCRFSLPRPGHGRRSPPAGAVPRPCSIPASPRRRS